MSEEYKFKIGDKVRYTSFDEKGKQYIATVVNIVPNYDNCYDIAREGKGTVAACERELDLLEHAPTKTKQEPPPQKRKIGMYDKVKVRYESNTGGQMVNTGKVTAIWPTSYDIKLDHGEGDIIAKKDTVELIDCAPIPAAKDQKFKVGDRVSAKYTIFTPLGTGQGAESLGIIEAVIPDKDKNKYKIKLDIGYNINLTAIDLKLIKEEQQTISIPSPKFKPRQLVYLDGGIKDKRGAILGMPKYSLETKEYLYTVSMSLKTAYGDYLIDVKESRIEDIWIKSNYTKSLELTEKLLKEFNPYTVNIDQWELIQQEDYIEFKCYNENAKESIGHFVIRDGKLDLNKIEYKKLNAEQLELFAQLCRLQQER